MSVFKLTSGNVRCEDCGVRERGPCHHDCGLGTMGLTLAQVETSGVNIQFACGHPVALAVPGKCGTCRASLLTLRGELRLPQAGGVTP